MEVLLEQNHLAFSVSLFSFFPHSLFSPFFLLLLLLLLFFRKEEKNRAILTNVNPMKPVTSVLSRKPIRRLPDRCRKGVLSTYTFVGDQWAGNRAVTLTMPRRKGTRGIHIPRARKSCSPARGRKMETEDLIYQQLHFMRNVHLRAPHRPLTNKLIPNWSIKFYSNNVNFISFLRFNFNSQNFENDI